MQTLPVMSSYKSTYSLSIKEVENLQKGFVRTRNADHQEVKLLKGLFSPVMAALVALSPLCYPPDSFGQLTDTQKGGALFRRACIGCHDRGGNIIQPGATLLIKDLQRNGTDKEDEIYRITYYGKGRMPGFGENCTPKGQCTFGPRLKDEEIKILAEFVKSQADQGWPNIEIHGD